MGDQTENKTVVNIPEADLSPQILSPKNLRKTIEHSPQERLSEIEREFSEGFKFIEKYKKSVTFYGSARFLESDEHYIQARALSNQISKELGYAIVTGGGPGIMEAANRGAFDAGGISLGLNIELPREQVRNPYLTDYMDFYYFFVRKVILAFSAEAYVFFPGGFGTLDEFFEIITLVQTNKIQNVPVILVGSDFWRPLQDFIQKNLLEEHSSIDKADLALYTITDSVEEIMEIVKKAPLRKE